MEDNIRNVINLYKSDYTQEILELFHDDVVNFFNLLGLIPGSSASTLFL